MATETITNTHGVKFYIEESSDFDDSGRPCKGRGWFAGIVKGNDYLGGVFFETKDAALAAISEYEGV